ncbi:DUF3558 domain-containing protein [Amycolatopsis sp. PS_44_ISF1]|uniref:DUF3558 domain-containing protein n=1 Tax=Amycolatopsis sp. PS_44_ISF1 TaxID=2974917 RepID=UPI0028DF5196|nr:DUF3558 domain-containing protein [Amycolatopsis sp. PS_44_ISF1]MDT8910667.1 DUF3558 domain-containing protein [Amycolatopsis sp. PS_44_ISF1]
MRASTGRSSGRWAAAAVVLGSLGVAGCSAGDSGTAFPVETAATAMSQAAKASELPPRPAELSFTGLDPCDLLAQVQLDELEVTGVPRRAADPPDGPTCVFDVGKTPPFRAYHLRTVGADLQQWLTGARRKSSMTTTPVTVAGYPALTNYRAGGDPSDCETLVGVAKGQTLAAQAFAISAGADNQQQLCTMSTHAAELAVQNLKSRS